MYSYSTPAIILKKRDFREADRLYTLLTPEFGKIMVIAQGSRKLQSKMAGHLEVGGVARVMCIPGKSLDRIAGAVAERSALQVIGNFGQRWFFLDLVDALLHEGAKDHPLYGVVAEYLETQTQPTHPLHLPYFCSRVFAALGFAPSGETCAVCRDPLGESSACSPRHGGIAHAGCAGDDPDAFDITPDMLVFWNACLREPWTAARDIWPNPQVVRDIEGVVIALARLHSRRKISTAAFLGI